MKIVSRRFADLAMTLEDLHGIAVEGQAARLSPDIHRALLFSIQTCITRLNAIADRIGITVCAGDRRD